MNRTIFDASLYYLFISLLSFLVRLFFSAILSSIFSFVCYRIEIRSCIATTTSHCFDRRMRLRCSKRQRIQTRERSSSAHCTRTLTRPASEPIHRSDGIDANDSRSSLLRADDAVAVWRSSAAARLAHAHHQPVVAIRIAITSIDSL